MKWAALISIFLYAVIMRVDGARAEEDDVIFLPGVYFLADAATVSSSDADFTSISRKMIEIHIARYGAFDASFSVHERLLTSERYDEKLHPFRIEYLMEYFKLSRRFSGFSLGVVFDHICYNIIDEPEDTDAYQLRWYGIGVQVASYGMSPGRDGLHMAPSSYNFHWLLNPQFLFSASIPLHVEQFRYDCRAKGVFRMNFFSLMGVVSYLEAEVEALVDNEVRFDRTFEAGLYATLCAVTFSAFAGYQYRHDALLYNGPSDSSWLFGVRAEALIGYEGSSAKLMAEEEKNYPAIRFSGGYGKRIGSEYLGYLTELGADLDAVRSGNLVVVFSADTEHYSKAKGNALFPRYISLSWGGGIEYFLSESLFAGISYESVVRCDGNAYRGHDERYHVLGVSFATRSMRRGESDYEDDRRDDGFAPDFEYRLFVGPFLRTEGWGYDMEYSLSARWDAFRYGLAICYAGADGAYYYGDKSTYCWAVEGGVRLRFNVILELYYRYERVSDIDRYDGAAERSAIIGFRVQR